VKTMTKFLPANLNALLPLVLPPPLVPPPLLVQVVPDPTHPSKLWWTSTDGASV
jgi:hypothetical protein